MPNEVQPLSAQERDNFTAWLRNPKRAPYSWEENDDSGYIRLEQILILIADEIDTNYRIIAQQASAIEAVRALCKKRGHIGGHVSNFIGEIRAALASTTDGDLDGVR